MRPLPRLLATFLIATAAASAQAWPDQPITLVVPYTPGTGIDLIARQLSAKLPGMINQPVVVDNVPGASGNIGTEKVARAKPDGYTLFVQVSTMVMNKSLYKSLPYDPVNDLTPVTLTSWGTLLLVTNPNVQKATSIAQVIAAAKAEPGKLTYATPGVGTPHHLAMAQMLQNAGAEMLHVPYKGTAGAVTDLLGGRIDYMFLPVHVALQHIQAGKLKSDRDRQRQAPCATARGTDTRGGRRGDWQRRHVVRRAGAQGHACGSGGAAQQGNRRRAQTARGGSRIQCAGHGAREFDSGGIQGSDGQGREALGGCGEAREYHGGVDRWRENPPTRGSGTRRSRI